jgi:uncharacterized protein DUF6615
LATLCGTFRWQAGAVWNRTSRATALQLFMSEETTTEMVLYEIARHHQTGDYIAIPATKAAEAKHGADWLWWFGDKSNGVGFRVQAKKLFPSGQYESLLKKKGDPYDQLKNLVASAHQANQIPLYCFYNFSFGKHFPKCDHHCQHDYRGPSYWGCAVALPEDVQRQNSDAFSDLQDYMLPWHLLVCAGNNTSLADAAVASSRMLASAKPTRILDDGRVSVGRDQLDISFAKRPAPQAIRDIIEIQERKQPADAQADARLERRREIDDRAQSFLDEQGVAGIVIFNDSNRRERSE